MDNLHDIHNLNILQFHHQNVGNYEDVSPSNIFALEPDMMYMPEVTAWTASNQQSTENNNTYS